jgi:hypothetical protein
LDFYQRFFELMHGESVNDIDILTLYLSKAAEAEVALTLRDWGFSVSLLYMSPDISQEIVQTQRTIATVSPLFQPYKALAEFLFQQALLSFKRGDMAGGSSLLQLATVIANLAPLLTLLTVAAVLGLIAYLLLRHIQKAKMKQTAPPPTPPPTPPPETPPPPTSTE